MMLFLKIGVALLAVHLLYISLPKHTPLKWRGRFLRWGLAATFLAVIISNIAWKGNPGPTVLHILPEITLDSPAEVLFTEKSDFTFTWMSALVLVYFTGFLLSLLGMMRGLWAYFKIHRTATRRGNSNIYEIPGRIAPFSFFNKIYLPAHLSPEEEKTILLHEQAHVRRNHGAELLAFRLMALAYWFWPSAHGLVQQVRLLHEFEADQHVLEKTQPDVYKKTLLQHSVLRQVPSVQSFTHSLKSRFAMMTIRPKNNKIGLALRALALGTFTVFISLSGIKAVAQTATKEKIVFAELDQLPRFTTCEVQDDKDEQFACFTQTMLTYISKNMVLNETLRSNKVAGRVFVQINFSEDGRTKDIIIMRGFNNDNEELEEAIQQQYDHIKEILLQLPRFEPGMKDGEKVSVEYIIPINFRLQEEAEE